MEIINKSSLENYYMDLFNDLKDNHEYYFMFKYSDVPHRYDVDAINSMIFYDNCLVIITNEDDRYIFEYKDMYSIEVICMGLIK